MKTYHYNDKPVKMFGLANFEKNGILERVPQYLREQVPSLSFLGRRIPGARMCFRTNARKIKFSFEFETLGPDIGMSIYACQSAEVFVGRRSESRYIGHVYPSGYSEENKKFSRELDKGNSETEDVTVFVPRNEIIRDMSITVDDDAVVEAPSEYKYSKPIVYYGSSITEGGCCCNVSSCYNAIISRHLDIDYLNLGFSGSAKGELEVADFINTLDMSIFVYDYDHNAPSAKHLEATHEPFFERIREKNPTLPVIMMSKPGIRYTDEDVKCRAAIRNTYDNAVSAGDKNVYFIDGETFYGSDTDRDLCSIDNIHPNDLGFWKMAGVVEPVIRRILEG